MAHLRKSCLDSADIREIYELLNIYIMQLSGEKVFEGFGIGINAKTLRTPETPEEREAMLDRLCEITGKLSGEITLSKRPACSEDTAELHKQLEEASRRAFDLKKQLVARESAALRAAVRHLRHEGFEDASEILGNDTLENFKEEE